MQRISSTDDSGIDSPTVADGKLLEEVEALSLSDSAFERKEASVGSLEDAVTGERGASKITGMI